MDTEDTDRTVGTWLAAAGLLLIAALALHPPPAAGTDAFMQQIAHEGQTWVVAHWLGAAAFSAFVVTGLLALTTPRHGFEKSAWALLVVGAFWVVFTAVAEATVVSSAARAGDAQTFAVWERFAAGTSMGFAVLAVGLAGIAAAARDAPVPTWSARTATVLALVAAAAWILSLGVGIAQAAPVWLACTFLVSAWTVWFGVASVRRTAAAPRSTGVHA